MDVTQLLIGCGLICLGFVIGVIMGNNRSPIADTVMSSVLTLIGTAITYFLFRKSSDGGEESEDKKTKIFSVSESNALTLAAFLILFPLSLLYGGNVGAQYRMVTEEYDDAQQYNSKLRLEKLELWKKRTLDSIELYKTSNELYYQKMYETWSENEKKRYEAEVSKAKSQETIPAVPNYFSK
ncbi:MAG TPA: hypothetical protein PKN96_11540 [Flavobacterium sp.]|uniref:hypothetical protein n=1 Tax=Flavobacterium sp. TaxID=239 RepID=UPI002D1B6D72|nr:hypothetical protein [Flavobacterium sp.]HNP33914.1 hypothetical protein [Flavobacterium sp.]